MLTKLQTTNVVQQSAGSEYQTPHTSEVRFVYDGWNLIATLNAQLATLSTYGWGLDLSGSLQGAGGVGGLLVCSNANSGLHFVAHDGNGNVAMLVDGASGGESARYEFGPFGELLRATGPARGINPFRFSTKYQDEETDLLYYGYRYYKASTGRWLSRDPFEEDGGLNVYCWASNNGINAYDILGLATRTFQLYAQPWNKQKPIALADVNVWRSSRGPVLIKLRVWRRTDEQSRKGWNQNTDWYGMPGNDDWDLQKGWRWPNMASLLSARGAGVQRYGEPDPRTGFDAAFMGATAMPEGGERPPLVSGDWLNDNGARSRYSTSHGAFLNPGFVISVSSDCPEPTPIRLWLVYPDGNRGRRTPGGWPTEWDGTVYLYIRITWSSGEPRFDVPDGPPPASPMANEWQSWKNSGAPPKFIYP